MFLKSPQVAKNLVAFQRFFSSLGCRGSSKVQKVLLYLLTDDLHMLCTS